MTGPRPDVAGGGERGEAGIAAVARRARAGETANARFKRRSGWLLWPAMILATGLHYAALAWLPGLTVGIGGTEKAATDVELVRILPRMELPPPPEPISRPPTPVIAEVAPPANLAVEAPVFESVAFEELPPPPPPLTVENTGLDRFVPTNVMPELRNRAEVARALERHYPRALAAAGIGGRVVMWFWIDEDGLVEQYELKRSSGYSELDSAAERVVQVMRFSPALRNGQGVPVVVELPIVFQAR